MKYKKKINYFTLKILSLIFLINISQAGTVWLNRYAYSSGQTWGYSGASYLTNTQGNEIWDSLAWREPDGGSAAGYFYVQTTTPGTLNRYSYSSGQTWTFGGTSTLDARADNNYSGLAWRDAGSIFYTPTTTPGTLNLYSHNAGQDWNYVLNSFLVGGAGDENYNALAYRDGSATVPSGFFYTTTADTGPVARLSRFSHSTAQNWDYTGSSFLDSSALSAYARAGINHNSLAWRDPDGGSVAGYFYQVAPEPKSVIMLFMGLSVLLIRNRRK